MEDLQVLPRLLSLVDLPIPFRLALIAVVNISASPWLKHCGVWQRMYSHLRHRCWLGVLSLLEAQVLDDQIDSRIYSLV